MSDDIIRVGQLLQASPRIVLDRMTLVYPSNFAKVEGLADFLGYCGQRINILRIETSANTFWTLDHLSDIARCCPLLDALEITNLKLEPEELLQLHMTSNQNSRQLTFRYLTQLKLRQVSADLNADALLLLLSACPDVEVLDVEFATTATFFSDFFLDDVLFRNPMGRLESFLLENASLTLISALRLLNSRPKLRTIGHILKWDVEPTELEMFGQIVHRAKSLNLLQHEVHFL